ncbi:hypothetical protein M0R45_021793 [Rubus argutus]|uniref:Uncharacterized protein n=1 Tax=Rubus argutus TaxID=59490 RepID=A0AAW1XDP8_RUBAR
MEKGLLIKEREEEDGEEGYLRCGGGSGFVGEVGSSLFAALLLPSPSICAVSGFSLIFGMACALETLSGQAYGARQYRQLGLHINTAIFSLMLVCLPLSLVWIYMGKILILMGQDPLISHEAALAPPYVSMYFSAGLCTPAPVHTPGFEFLLKHFKALENFLRFAIPSAVMICLEWWSFELLTLLAGFLPNPELETSVLSVSLATITSLYTIPEALGAAVSTRVSNELGAGNPQAARLVVVASMLLTVLGSVIIGSTVFASRSVFGYIFSNEKEVVDYVTSISPLICLSVIADSLHGVLSGIARGCGWQDLAVYVNLGAYYLVGIPVAVTLSFWFDFRGKGLWIGILVGSFLQTILYSAITSCINWEEKAKKAKERIFEETALS